MCQGSSFTKKMSVVGKWPSSKYFLAIAKYIKRSSDCRGKRQKLMAKRIRPIIESPKRRRMPLRLMGHIGSVKHSIKSVALLRNDLDSHKPILLSLKEGVIMKTLLLTLIFGVSTIVLAKGVEVEKPWHQPLDLSSQEYQKINAARAQSPTNLFMDADLSATDQALQTILKVGARNLQWVAAINKTRPPAQWILLSTPETQHAYPMDKPSVYNGDIVVKDYKTKMATMDQTIVAVLTGTDALPTKPSVSDDELTKAVRAVDGCYQMASRWLMMAPYLDQLAQEKGNDIRGYYFLSQMADRVAKLQAYSTLPSDLQAQIRGWLLQMCFNTSSDDKACAAEFDQAVLAKSDLNQFYSSFEAKSKEIYQSFFIIPTISYRTNLSFATID